MEPEPGEGLDAFLRRAAQVAALGAAVGAAVGAARAARSESGEDDERHSSEPEDGDDQRAQLRDEEPPAAREPERPEQEEKEEEESEQHPQQSAREEEARDEQPEEDESGPEEARGERPDGQITGEAASVIGRALPQLEQLTGRKPEGVLGLRRDGEGWLVTVEVVELPRVPSSTDVLATYDVVLDDDGEVREYRRTGRYIRGRADPSE
jgi:Gas vesicle synthesis protein GvpO